jgi:hypothetical protein
MLLIKILPPFYQNLFCNYLSTSSTYSTQLTLTEAQEKSFITLIKEHQGLIHKVCILYETDKEARNDLFQEIVLQLWKSFSNLQGRLKNYDVDVPYCPEHRHLGIAQAGEKN